MKPKMKRVGWMPVVDGTAWPWRCDNTRREVKHAAYDIIGDLGRIIPVYARASDLNVKK